MRTIEKEIVTIQPEPVRHQVSKIDIKDGDVSSSKLNYNSSADAQCIPQEQDGEIDIPTKTFKI
jgi:hypothetical protein